MKLIDKDALVAEIEKIIHILIKNSGCIGAFGENQITVYEDVLSLINSLGVKEVDLEKEIKNYFNNQSIITKSKGVNYQLIPSGEEIAVHFFELGLKAQKGE